MSMQERVEDDGGSDQASDAQVSVSAMTVLQSRARPKGVQQNACGRAAAYFQIAQYQFFGLTPPAAPPGTEPPSFQNPNF